MIHLSTGLCISNLRGLFIQSLPASFYPHLLHSFISYLLYVKAIGNTFGRRKADACNLLHVRSHIQGYLAHLVTAATGELKQDRSDRMNVRTFNDSNHTTFTTVSFFIGQDSIEFPTREGYLINTDTSTDILFE